MRSNKIYLGEDPVAVLTLGNTRFAGYDVDIFMIGSGIGGNIEHASDLFMFQVPWADLPGTTAVLRIGGLFYNDSGHPGPYIRWRVRYGMTFNWSGFSGVGTEVWRYDATPNVETLAVTDSSPFAQPSFGNELCFTVASDVSGGGRFAYIKSLVVQLLVW